MTKKSETKTQATVKYVKVYNNMRCGWVMPRVLLNYVPLASGEAAISSQVLYSTKARVGAMQSIIIEKDAFDNFVVNKQTGIVNKVLQNMINTKCLIVSGTKTIADARDWVDAPVKTEPSNEDLGGKKGEGSILQTQAMTIKVNKKPM